MDNDMHADGDNPHSHNYARSPTEPNEILVSEVNGVPPGRVLDVGSGSGGDAVWLASNGWQVTAIDTSQAAIDRATSAAEGTGMAITWVCADVARMPIDPGQYDLISIQYPALRRDTHQQVINTLLKAVAPGGTILVVTHGPESDSYARSYGIEATDYIDTADFAAAMDDNWEIAIKETRPRIARRTGSPFTHDIVLLAHRRS
jgi:2-polyprenyl-3-methyl-5-hydroxy-6-metoxy-1,4-benzoquinol methylase